MEENNMVSVIIPALNEGATIRKVIQRIKQTSVPLEIIVVDDNSTDNTVSEALKEADRVITSSKKGKGISMHEGMVAARYDTIVYLDADILTYPKNIIALLSDPIINGEADFVKSFFDRQAGRVTQLVAKPLLSIFFPELEKFTQPLSGMIAARKDFLQEIEFENDYGVDIALLIDAFAKKMRIKEVNIGFIRNDMQTLEALGKMSRQISRTILQKATLFSGSNLETLSDIQTISDEMDFAIRESILKLKKIIIIDINIILTVDFNHTAAALYNMEHRLMQLNNTYTDKESKLRKTASLFKGRSLPELQAIADTISFVPYSREAILQMKQNGYICILVSDGFDIVANHIKNKLGFDYCFANSLKMEKSIATGELEFPDYFNDPDEPGTKYDKSAILKHLTVKFNIPQKNIVFVGNTTEDIPMLQACGMGIVTTHAPVSVKLWADKILPAGSLKPLPGLLTGNEKGSSLKNNSVKYLAGIGIIAATAFAGYYLYSKSKKKAGIPYS
ncbi:HAD-IB family phosphatase [Agriterribacter sp.]|uniref:HAD-IB family phosphatase n=1 Tax=Agriterribacter sp. TaxID=2821509 RepID=UPI002CED1A92|nr:HAD-IB family phosphatase [Agriterribacter sp.]HRO47092.1 HAD-IB family phosphatase [Agriterribacter sp.]HRQ17849.1 HAD-IB family phosphatase [Agriterribacter sp.]